MCPVHVGESIVDLIDALGDPPTMKISSILREFSFGESHSYAFLDEDFEELADILGKNKVLKYFCLDLDPGEPLKYEHLFTRYHGQILDGYSERLPIKCKSAFLSVVDLANDPKEAVSIPHAAVIAQLDSSILSSIFQFSTSPVHRAVALKDYYPQAIEDPRQIHIPMSSFSVIEPHAPD